MPISQLKAITIFIEFMCNRLLVRSKKIAANPATDLVQILIKKAIYSTHSR